MTLALIKTLNEKRNQTWARMKEISDTAAAETRDLNTEERTNWDAANTELDQLDERITELRELVERQAASDDALRTLLNRPQEREEQEPDSVRDDLRAFLRGERRELEFNPASFDETRVLSGGAVATGGAVVRNSFYSRLIEHQVEACGILQLGIETIVTTTGELLYIPVTTGYSTSALTPESTAITPSDPSFQRRALSAYKFPTAVVAPVELIEDESYDLEGFIAKQAGRAVGNELAKYLVSGTGTNQPSGALTTATLGKTGTTAAPAYDDLIDLQFSVIDPYASSPSAGWLMRRLTLGAVRKLKDGEGRYIFEPAQGATGFDTILGQKVKTDPNMPAIGLAAKSILYGDFDAYKYRQVKSIRFEQSKDVKFFEDQVVFKAVVRGDGILADQTGALKYFQGSAA